MTLMKLSRIKPFMMNKIKVRKIDPQLYGQWADADFGPSLVKDIQLLDMRQKEEDGFYKCLAKIVVLDDGVSPEAPVGMEVTAPSGEEGGEGSGETTNTGNGVMESSEVTETVAMEDRDGVVLEHVQTLTEPCNETLRQTVETLDETTQQTGAGIVQTVSNSGRWKVNDFEPLSENLIADITNPASEVSSASGEMGEQGRLPAVGKTDIMQTSSTPMAVVDESESEHREEAMELEEGMDAMESRPTNPASQLEDIASSITVETSSEVDKETDQTVTTESQPTNPLEDLTCRATVETLTEEEMGTNQTIPTAIPTVSESENAETNGSEPHCEEVSISIAGSVTDAETVDQRVNAIDDGKDHTLSEQTERLIESGAKREDTAVEMAKEKQDGVSLKDSMDRAEGSLHELPKSGDTLEVTLEDQKTCERKQEVEESNVGMPSVAESSCQSGEWLDIHR